MPQDPSPMPIDLTDGRIPRAEFESVPPEGNERWTLSPSTLFGMLMGAWAILGPFMVLYSGLPDEQLAVSASLTALAAIIGVIILDATVLVPHGLPTPCARRNMMMLAMSVLLPPSDPRPTSAPAAPAPEKLGARGQDEATKILASYARDLGEEANRIARQFGALEASPKHVQMAATRIQLQRTRSSVGADLLLAVGSMLIGLGGGFWVNLASGGRDPHTVGPWAVAALVVGVAMFASGATAKWAQR
jgi:hypothetical protein